MTLKTAACRFFLISRLYSMAASLAGVLSLTLTCIAAGLATPAGQQLNDADVVILACSVTAAVLQGVSHTLGLAEAAERCRGISRDLNRLDKDVRAGRLSDEQRDRKYAAIQRRVPIGTCMWLR